MWGGGGVVLRYGEGEGLSRNVASSRGGLVFASVHAQLAVAEAGVSLLKGLSYYSRPGLVVADPRMK